MLDSPPTTPTLQRDRTERAAPRRGLLQRIWGWFDTQSEARLPDADAPQKVDWVGALPFLAMHAACLGVLWVGWSPVAVSVAAALYVVRMLGLTSFYHRYFSHRTFKANRFWQAVFAVWGASCVQRGPLWWAAHHRHHHRHSDEPEDVHSPKQHGFWWSHMGWIMSKVNAVTHLDRVKDLAKFPELRFLDRFHLLVPLTLAGTMYGLGVLLEAVAPSLGTSGPQMLVWGFFVSTVVLFHGTCTINSLSHVWGRRRYETTDTSRNNWFLAIVTLGEGWHNNHHHYPGTARQGFRWWEYDVSWYFLNVLAMLRVIRGLKGVPAHVKAEGSR